MKLEIRRSRLCELLFSESIGSESLNVDFLIVFVTASSNLDPAVTVVVLFVSQSDDPLLCDPLILSCTSRADLVK